MEAAPSGTCDLILPAKDKNSRGSQAGLTCFSLEVTLVTFAHDSLARPNSGYLTARRLGQEGSSGMSGEHHSRPHTGPPPPPSATSAPVHPPPLKTRQE